MLGSLDVVTNGRYAIFIAITLPNARHGEVVQRLEDF